MSIANNLTLTLAQAATLIETIGADVTVLLRGQPGIGKSDLLKTLSARMPDYHVAYIDTSVLDLGDVAMPVVDREHMVTHYAPNARFGTAQGKPVMLMLDELGKASRPVMNMLLPTILEKRIGDRKLPPGSIVFGTTNLETDGVNDVIPPHAYNRMTVVRISNPTAEEWLLWASNNDVDPAVMAFAKQYPQVFDCYADMDAKDSNPYIFDPRRGNIKAFCSPRSLAKSSPIVRSRRSLGDALLPTLAGTIGEAAARDMEALVHLSDQIPTFEEVVKAPAKTKLPADAAGFFIMAFMLAGRVTPETTPQVMTYMDRWADTNFEACCLLVSTIVGTPKIRELHKIKEFSERVTKYAKYFVA